MTYNEAAYVKNLIRTHLTNNNIKEAVSLSQKLLSEFPCDEDLPRILSNRHILYEVKPNNWQAWWVIAQAARISGDIELVDKACSIILREQPDFWFARELPKHARGYYAQLDQDKFIEIFFQEHGVKNNFFVEVGAFDGVHYSNVRRLFEVYGWTGICIEPVSYNYEKLKLSYKDSNVKCLKAAVSNEEGKIALNVSSYPHLPAWGSDVASISGSDTHRWTQQYGAKWHIENVIVKRLTTILDEHNIHGFDLLSVDAEGHDLEALEGLDFNRFKPRLIVVEYGEKRQEILSFLANRGYSLLFDNGQDLFMGDIQTPIDQGFPTFQPEIKGSSYQTGKETVIENVSNDKMPESYWISRKENVIGMQTLEELRRTRQLEIYRAIFEAVKSRSVSEVVDIGCNIAALGQLLYDWGYGGHYMGVDSNPYALDVARRALVAMRQDCIFINANARSLPFSDHSVECVVIKDVLEHMEDYRPILCELARVSSKYVFVANFLPWIDGKTKINPRPEGFYLNIYDRNEVLHFASTIGLRFEEVIPAMEKGIGPNELVIFKRELIEDSSPVRLYYIPNGDDYHIAALLRDTFAEVKPFGCKDVQDYIDRRILAYQTPGASQILYEEVKIMRPDLIYVESGYNIEPAMLQRIRTELGIPTTMWFGDACANQQFVDRILYYAQRVDWQVVVDSRVFEEARRRLIDNVEFIPFFGYDHYFYPLDIEKKHDILFSGKSYAEAFVTYPFAVERLAFILAVNNEFGSRLKVIGPGWDRYGLANYENQRVPEWEINKLNNQSKIVLAFDAVQVEDFTSCRIYNALLGKSFVLTRKYPGIDKYFVNGEHLVWFEDQNEGISLLRYFLKNSIKRDQIAQQGYDHVHRNGWKFSNVARYLVRRGLKREIRNFQEIYAPFSKRLPQKVKSGIEVLPQDATESKSEIYKVSAMVSTYNSERFMRGCLEDLVDQTLYEKGDLEIVVIDSGSRQNEKSIAEEFQQRYRNIKYIRTEERGTVYAAWNRGIRAASGEYITNANTDDRHRKDALEIMANILARDNEVDLVYADVIVTETENETFEEHTAVDYYRWVDYERERLTETCFMGPQPMWRKSLHDRHGYFDETFSSSGDWEFWLRIAESADFFHIPEFLGLYFRSRRGLENSNMPRKLKENRMIYKIYVPKYLPSYEQYFDRLISTDPALIHIYLYGQILSAFDKYDKAISLYTSFLEKNPDNKELTILLDYVRTLKAEHLSAQATGLRHPRQMRPAEAIRPSVADKIMAFIHQADSHIADNDFVAAREAIKQALHHAAGDHDLVSLLNNILVQFSDPESARKFLQSQEKR